MFARLIVLLVLAGALFTLPLSSSAAQSGSDKDEAVVTLQNQVNSLQSDFSSLKLDIATLQSMVSSQAAALTAQQKIINDQQDLLLKLMHEVDTARTNSSVGSPNTPLPQKTILLRGAALLYYACVKCYAQHADILHWEDARVGPFREAKGPYSGAVYYRKGDAAHTPVWLTVPAQGLQVAVNKIKRYAPDYKNYSQQTPAIPAGAPTVSVTQFDPSL